MLAKNRDQPLEILKAVPDRQSPAASFAGNPDQHLMPVLGDVDGYENGRSRYSLGNGHGRSPLRCGSQNHCRDLKPGYGPEFAASSFRLWLMRVGNQPLRIFPGSPWENGYNERFNGTLRREVLNAEWFATTRQAQVSINQWLRQYNHIRPHHALAMRPPVPETLLEKSQISRPTEGG